MYNPIFCPVESSNEDSIVTTRVLWQTRWRSRCVNVRYDGAEMRHAGHHIPPFFNCRYIIDCWNMYWVFSGLKTFENLSGRIEGKPMRNIKSIYHYYYIIVVANKHSFWTSVSIFLFHYLLISRRESEHGVIMILCNLFMSVSYHGVFR